MGTIPGHGGGPGASHRLAGNASHRCASVRRLWLIHHSVVRTTTKGKTWNSTPCNTKTAEPITCITQLWTGNYVGSPTKFCTVIKTIVGDPAHAYNDSRWQTAAILKIFCWSDIFHFLLVSFWTHQLCFSASMCDCQCNCQHVGHKVSKVNK